MWGDWSTDALADAAEAGPLYINPIVYSEVSIRFSTVEALEDALPSLGAHAAVAGLEPADGPVARAGLRSRRLTRPSAELRYAALVAGWDTDTASGWSSRSRRRSSQ